MQQFFHLDRKGQFLNYVSNIKSEKIHSDMLRITSYDFTSSMEIG